MPHTTHLKVRFYELDPYNHVNHSVYFQYFETARIALLAEAGYGLREMKDAGMIWVVAQVETKFHKPARAGDHLVVETEIPEMSRVASTWRQRILRDGELLVSQDLVGAITSPEGRPQRLPEAMRTALALYQV